MSQPAPQSRLPHAPRPHDTPRVPQQPGPSEQRLACRRARASQGGFWGTGCLSPGALRCGCTPGAANPKFTLSCEARPAFYYRLLTSAGYGTNYFGGPPSRDEELARPGEAFPGQSQREPACGTRPDREGVLADLSSGWAWPCVPAEQGAQHPSFVICPI